jgi:hypothetical protein
MKKLLILFISLVSLTACKDTTPSQDTQMLQSKYDIVYPLGDDSRFICCDTLNHVYLVRISRLEGKIFSTVKIK